jgi:hypothetical protein
VRRATAVFVMALLGLVAACTPAAPTPTQTPEPTPTRAWILATKPEHLAGLWYARGSLGSFYTRFEPDGTMKWEVQREGPTRPTRPRARFWFEDGVYYQHGDSCDPIGSYRAYLEIEEGQAVRLRFEEIDDSDPSCLARRGRMSLQCFRVDR